MADDTYTVERARQDVLDIVAAYGIVNSEKGPFAQYLDALIAAVRAEKATPPSIDDEMAKLRTVTKAFRDSGLG